MWGHAPCCPLLSGGLDSRKGLGLQQDKLVRRKEELEETSAWNRLPGTRWEPCLAFQPSWLGAPGDLKPCEHGLSACPRLSGPWGE